MSKFPSPYLIEFPKLGAPEIGYISVTEQQKLIPFDVQRIFWTYYTPESIVRGRHAHHQTQQVLVAVSGRITVTTEMADGTIQTFRLEDPNVGLYVPPHAWHTMQYSHSAVQLVMASAAYDEADYIRQYEQFQTVWKAQQ
ncbi:sugar 3,4-ketoisomerase [Hymenobacter properus]|uniref:FdtA/QdtA family cupin domain-containing protein n=1 Tax=Hymenobacter properus TaxID=2791026 RepID=A0A931BJ43_9BACT|nr:FdtA/QdtA family cupin domain-containing protein [Hymenobacter properus]MBF9143451.1 FdtA/QdtA family cupin domain-containing protein [Hymenobacter properus]MBR7722264.1 FdtA/QdtA family cupin domain-containing protein [Microvirga sp. SRT04]